jgi:hypothetical protein
MRSLLKNPVTQAESKTTVSASEPLLSARLARLLGWALFAVQALVLIAIIFKTRPWLTGDSARYLALADALGGGRGYSLWTGQAFEPESIRMPGYPVFIMVFQKLLGQGQAVVVLIQGVLFLFAVWLMWRVTTRAFGQLTGICFLALSAVYPFIAYSAGQVSPEMPTVFLMALVFFLLLRPTTLRLAGVGALIAVATYFRPNLLLLGVALAPALLLADRRLYLKALLPLLISGALLLPWAIHNYLTFGVFTPTSVVTGSGINLFLGSWQSRVSVPSLIQYGMTGNAPPELESAGMLEQVRAVNREIDVPSYIPCVNMGVYPDNERRIKAEKLYRGIALSNIRAWPGTYLRGSARNTLRMWFTAYLPESFPSAMRLALVLEGLLVLGLGIIGAALALYRERGPQRRLVFNAVSALLYFTFTLCWFHTEARYTIPVRLMLLTFSAYALKSLLEVCVARINMRSRSAVMISSP